MKKNSGVSLIILVITIIVISILAAAVIVNLAKNNPISQANEAKTKSDMQSYNDLFSLWLGKEYVSSLGSLDPTTVNVDKNGGTYVKDGGTIDITLNEVIPGISGTAYADKIIVDSGKLKFISNDIVEQNYAISSGIPLATYTKIKGSNIYNIPYIPTGFYYVGGTWDTGLVISDNSNDLNLGVDSNLTGNQFVWVPVDGTNVSYAKWCTTGLAWNNSSISNDTVTGIANETAQITTYGGFYIARYEARFDYNGGTLRVASKPSLDRSGFTDWSTTRNETYNGYLWNYISYADAKFYAENMDTNYSYDTSKVITTLVSGTEWDTALKWISNNPLLSVINSTIWGNHSDSAVTGAGSLQKSGYSKNWKANNIYDMAGNAWEFTSEIYSNACVTRGGCYSNSGSSVPASFRNGAGVTGGYQNVSFRTALFIL